ncbi:hypothetical protein ABT084_15950 [Streptomyces sp. NPDC002138]|uniref:hypothetical protein n=1 Tax=Streptomyces sp. NPDC002138 TaxID=3154410 RepID=UPI00333407F5
MTDDQQDAGAGVVSGVGATDTETGPATATATAVVRGYPATADGHAALAALRALADRRPDDVELLDGFRDADLDAWPVHVPEAVRIVLRETGGLEVDDVRIEFGPHGKPHFTDGCWILGELDAGEGSLIVGVPEADGRDEVGGGGCDDWGPVLAVYTWGEQEITVEAPGFTGWLTGLATRLAEGADPEDRPAPRFFVPARPSIEAAEGPDAELAALVGRGDSLTDVADLRDLPGHPCGIGWEPYFSTAFNTADTGSSEVQFRLAGGGRALLLRSVVSGDFLGRPVRRHRVPTDAASRAVRELRSLAAELPELVRLDEGCSDAAMDAWEVPVPEEIRTVLRAIGGVRMAGAPPLRLLPGGEADTAHAVDPEVHRMMGGDGTYHPIARVDYARSSALAQIRVDPKSGHWGAVVSIPTDLRQLRTYPELCLLAESLPVFLLTLVRLARRSARTADFARALAGATHWMFPNTGEAWTRPVPVAEWAGSPDPLRAAVTALPAGAHAADLRDSPAPSDLCFHRAAQWPRRGILDRLYFPGAGLLAAAVPVAAPAAAPVVP